MPNQSNKGILVLLFLIVNLLILLGLKEISDSLPLAGEIPLALYLLLIMLMNFTAYHFVMQVYYLEEMCNIMLGNINEMVFVFDCNTARFTSANQLVTELLGYRPEEITDLEALRNAVHPDDKASWDEDINTIELNIAKGDFSNFRSVKRFLSKTGESFYLDTNFIPLKRGNTIKVIATSRDISGRVILEQNLKAANLAKDQFLANISHELRTPMIGILGSVDLLEQSRLNKEQTINLATVRECGEQLLNIINELLDVSKIELGLLTLAPEVCNLPEFINGTVKIMEPVFKEKGLQLILNLDSKLPARALIDKTKLRQVLLNILNNAVKFTKRGVIIIDTHAQINLNQESYLLVSISDTGVGIPKNQQDKIFEPFTQGDSSTSREFGGTGIGLYICKKIINLMQGEIWLDSSEGKGTVFYLKIPLEIASADQIVASPEEAAEVYESGNNFLFEFNPVKVLIVEDNFLTQKITGQILSNYGFEAIYASNGLECLKILSEKSIDMVLMDMQMPLMDGYETTRFIRADSELHNIPVIAMTAHAMAGDRSKCLDSGCTDYISKPFKGEELVQIIKKNLPQDFRNRQHINNGKQLINELLPEFIVSLREMVEELDQAIQNKNHEMIQSISHDIKGTAGMYNFMEISQTAALMEQAAKDKSYPKLNALNNKINTLFQQAKTKVS